MGKASRPPELDTVWEFIDAVPSQDDALSAAPEDARMQGVLFMRPTTFWARLLQRRAWLPRFAVLEAAHGSTPPRLLLFQTEAMDTLLEDIWLTSPLQLHCHCSPAEASKDEAARDGGEGGASSSAHMGFTLRTAQQSSDVELAAIGELDRSRWLLALGESVSAKTPPPSPPPLSPSSPAALRTAGRVRLASSRLADRYSMGKVLVQGEGYCIVEGLHLATSSSHALKLVSKTHASPEPRPWGRSGIRPHAAWSILSKCLHEVYEGANHVCIVMHWGTHDLDGEHHLSSAVLEALRLLHEVLPSENVKGDAGVMLGAEDMRCLMLRVLALDCHLQSNLFF